VIFQGLSRRLDRVAWRLNAWGWLAAALACAIAIISVGLRPAADLDVMPVLPPGSDKVLHFLAYALFSACVFRIIYPFSPREPARIPRGWVLVIASAATLGAIDEFLQGFAAGRSQDPKDWLADFSAGVVIALWGVAGRALRR